MKSWPHSGLPRAKIKQTGQRAKLECYARPGCTMDSIPASFFSWKYNGHHYTGSIYFDDIGFCYEIDTVLKSNLWRSMKEIGDLDLAHLL